MARKKKLDLDSAKQADAALPPIRNIFDLVGVKNVSYWQKTYPDYQKYLRGLSMVELIDHAHEVNVVPGPTREIAIDRLERKFLRERPEEHEKYLAAKDKGIKDEQEMTVAERAALIMSRAR